MIVKKKTLLRALAGETVSPPPVWLMRQAGRYLPEYRAVRARAGDFLDLCFTPELAVEITLQPIRRFGFDAAILFSDILVVPHALGQKVDFVEGSGPQLAALSGPDALDGLRRDGFGERLEPVYAAVRRLASELPAETTLIGFAGAPWTVASYMLEGGSSRDFAVAKSWAYETPESMQRLIDLLIEVTSDHLCAQARAGAEALQIFDSWAGVWPERHFRRWCLDPMMAVVRRVQAAHPDVPVIGFPRGAGLYYEAFAASGKLQGLSLDTTVPLAWARDTLQQQVTLQGNLDPMALVAGGAELARAAAEIRESLGSGPFIFNLGHGIVPQTPIAHVEQLLGALRG